MSKGSYTVYKPEKPNSKLNSWKSCTCSLLIFAAISLIIILVAWPLKKTNEVDIFTGENAKVSRYTESVETFSVKNDSPGKFAKIVGSTIVPVEETYTSTVNFENKDVNKIKPAYITNKPQDTTTESQEHHRKLNTILISTGANSSTLQPEKEGRSATEVYQNDSYTSATELYMNNNRTELTEQSVKDESTVTQIYQNGPSILKNLHFNTNKTESSDEPVENEITVTQAYQNDPYASTKNLYLNDNKTESLKEPVTDESTVTQAYHNDSFTSMRNLHLNGNNTESSDKPNESTVTQVYQNTSNTSAVTQVYQNYKNLHLNDNKTESSDEQDKSTVTQAYLTATKNLHPNDNKSESSDEQNEITVTQAYQNDSYTSMKNLHLNGNKTESSEDKDESTVMQVYQNISNTSMKYLHSNDNKTESSIEPEDESAISKIYQISSTQSTSTKRSVLEKIEQIAQEEPENHTTTEVYKYALSHSTDSSIKDSSKHNDDIKSITYSQPIYKATTDYSHRVFFEGDEYPTEKLYTKKNNTVLTTCQSTIRDREVCDTNNCKNIGSKVLTLIKHDENICYNFYNYACGGISKDFLVKTESSADLWARLKHSLDGANENSSDYLITFKNYFLSCMDYDFWNKLPGSILEDVGTFYRRSDDLSGAPTLTMLLTKLLTKNYAALFDIKMDIDIKSQKLGLVILPVFNDEFPASLYGNVEYKNMCLEKCKLKQGEVNLNDAYSMYKTCQLDKSLYISNVRRALVAFDAFPSCNVTDKIVEIQHLLFTLEEHMLNGQNQTMQPLVMEQNKMFKSKSSSNLSFHTLKLRLPQIDWDYLFKELVGIPLPRDVNIQIYFVNYLSKLLNILIKVNKRELHNSILAMYAHKLYKDYVLDHRDICDKYSHCLKLSNKHMPDISSALYLKSFKANEIEEMDKIAKDIFKYLKKSLLNEIQNGNWLSKEDPENRAYDKIYDLNLTTVGDLMPWKNDILLNGLKEMNIKPDCFIENTNTLEKHKRKMLYSSFDGDPMIPENLWTLFSLPSDTKTSNLIPLNTIVLPLGAMSQYLDNPGSPKFISMAGLGFTLAKQMNNLLELSGMPILRKIDTQPPNIFFEMNQTIDGRPLTVDLNPTESITEIVTDVAGAKLAYLAYKKYNSKNDFPLIWTNKTSAQSYFLLLAQQFCTKKSILVDYLGLFEGTELPAMFAVNSIAVNTDEFFEVYNDCSPETNMTAGIKIPLVSSTFTTKKIDTMDTTK